MSVRVSHKLVLAFGVPTLVFVTLGIAGFLVFSQVTRETAAVARAREVMLELRWLQLATARAEAGRAEPGIAPARETLARLFEKNPAQAGHLRALGPWLDRLAAGTADPAALAPLRKVELQVEDDLRAEGDAPLVKIALTNLIENAWKFSAKEDCAKIEVGRSGEAFYVRDNGAGYDPTYQDKLFGAFQRLHPAAEFEGTGIGLATVQRVVARHGGRVWSEGKPGEGASFYFTLGSTAEEA